MRIISKYKDYYDYLVGIYGEDPLIVYVRSGEPLVFNTNFFKEYLNPYKYPTSVATRVGYFRDAFGKFDHQIPPYTEKRSRYMPHWSFIWDHKPLHEKQHGSIRTFYLIIGYYEYHFEMDRYTKDDGSIVDDILMEKKRIDKRHRSESNAPIYVVMHDRRDVVHPRDSIIENPILKDTFIGSYIPAEDIWEHVSEYIGLEKEVESRPLTDKEKIVQHGFDKVTSFRKM